MQTFRAKTKSCTETVTVEKCQKRTVPSEFVK